MTSKLKNTYGLKGKIKVSSKNVYIYRGKKIKRKKLTEEILNKYPTFKERNYKYGWEIEHTTCLFGGLTKACDFIDGLI